MELFVYRTAEHSRTHKLTTNEEKERELNLNPKLRRENIFRV